MAYTTINKSTDHFDGKTYLGSSNAVTVSGLGFQPDWVWVKDRDNGNNHVLVDAVRGAGKFLQSNLTNAEVNNSSQSISAFTSDGFTTGTANPANESASTTKGFISWNWKASGSTASNTDGSINSTVSANTTAGFSIVSYTGTGSNATVGHGLGSAPGWIVLKNRTTNRNWEILHHRNTASPATQQLEFITDATATVTTQWNSVMPTSSVFSIGTNDSTNKNGDSFIAYCFAEKTGYSKFGSYKGNESTDGTFVYTGFKPAWIMGKRTDSANNWYMFDSTRDTFNVTDKKLRADTNAVENVNSSKTIDILSNGFKIKSTDAEFNASGGTYIFMAFGQTIVGSNNIPATAR